ncbi:uncharacterized protein ALTATR162_LOCUS10612 [Alternaria atra]|uniref:Uncharacterized protein n=1 Tax=Alternaria atra TaxID=119953 RepID=A0A8J2N8M9_9PLEO|nr:uncharacterized protein ALTATR162_LOCUS8133 [Alternaria atra]XP_043174184.1 uncharacterized protein ALTATR162_LOCUS10612 [Alternaria atra]CAG5175556.1 unnamed protein product [Alternaria atra]CAG5183500.1 unnamed protein product [Alternaria atra]
MTLPRASKKSTSATPSIAATRQGAQQSRRQIIGEAEELDDSGEANSAGDDEDSGHEGTQASQNTSDGPLEHLMAKMVEDQRKRYDMLKKNVGRTYNNHYDNIEESINIVYDTHEQEASTAHQAQLKRLQDLFDQKTSIETAMTRQLASLQKIYHAHSRDLEAVVDRRLREMK